MSDIKSQAEIKKVWYETCEIRMIKLVNVLSQNPAKKLPASEGFCIEDSSKKHVDNWLDIRLMELFF